MPATDIKVQGSKAQEVRVDEEAPVSRNPSPMPSPLFGPTSTRRGEHYSYSTVPTSEEQDTYFTSPGGATQNGSTLSVPAKGKPLIGKRRGSATSEFGRHIQAIHCHAFVSQSSATGIIALSHDLESRACQTVWSELQGL
jgi:hypothetical protein